MGFGSIQQERERTAREEEKQVNCSDSEDGPPWI